MTEEKRQQQRPDVGSVHIGVGHQDHLAVSEFRWIEVILANAAAKRRDHGANFLMAQHLVVAGLLNIENLCP